MRQLQPVPKWFFLETTASQITNHLPIFNADSLQQRCRKVNIFEGASSKVWAESFPLQVFWGFGLCFWSQTASMMSESDIFFAY